MPRKQKIVLLLFYLHCFNCVFAAFREPLTNLWTKTYDKGMYVLCMPGVCPNNLSKHVISRARVGRLCTTINITCIYFKSGKLKTCFIGYFVPTSEYLKVTYILTGARHGRYPFMAPRVYDPLRPVSLVQEPSTQNIGLIRFIMISVRSPFPRPASLTW